MTVTESPPSVFNCHRRWFRVTPDRLVIGLVAVECLLWLSERFQWFGFNQHKGYAVLVTVAIAGAVLLGMLLAFVVSLLFRRRFQFGISFLLLLAVAVALPCGWFMEEIGRAKKLKAVVDEVNDGVGICYFDWENVVPEPPVQVWLRKLLGNCFFGKVDTLVIQPGPFNMAGLRRVKKLSELRYLEIHRDEWTDSQLEFTGTLSQLEFLVLDCRNVTDSALKHLERLEQLEDLSLVGTQVTGAGLMHLKALPHLQSLSLRASGVTDAGLAHFKRLPGVTSLDLGYTATTDVGLRAIEDSTQLKSLCLDGTRITDEGMELLRGLTKLRVLMLSETKVTDAGLARLKTLTQLQELWLDKTNVADAGLEHLETLTRLQILDLQGTKVTDAGVKKLQKALPKCRMVR